MKIATRIKILAIINALGIISLILLSQYSANRVFNQVNFANINSIPAMSALAEANEYFLRMRISLQRHVILTNLEDKAKEEASIATKKEKVDKALVSYKSTIVDEKDKALYDVEVSKLALYYDAMQNVIALSRNHINVEKENSQLKKDSSQPAADKSLEDNRLSSALESADKLGRDVTKALDEHAEYNQQLATQNAALAISSKNTAAITSGLFGLVILVAVISILGLTLRALMRQLGAEPSELAKLASNFADGDLKQKFTVAEGDKTSVAYSIKVLQRTLD
ncbi:MAG TPA: MCP four helix bundle domain-containing protein, partial [Methylophilaceae bacterium]